MIDKVGGDNERKLALLIRVKILGEYSAQEVIWCLNRVEEIVFKNVEGPKVYGTSSDQNSSN